jgi:Domain of unknown function (DUF5666)
MKSLQRMRPMRWSGWLGGVLAAAVLASCGVGTGGTGAYSSGPINGFGSIIVSGVRFDESRARVEDEEGIARDRSLLRLGMMVEIDSGAIAQATTGPVATATRVRFGSELVGRLEAVDAVAGTMRVIGQTVHVDAGTVFDGALAGGLAGLVPGTVLEVYGFFDSASAGVLATRVEPRSPAPATYKIRGPIAQLDTAARRFSIGSEAFDYGAVPFAPGGLANGVVVRATLATARDALGRWPVQSLSMGQSTPGDRDEAHVKGLTSAFSSAASFRVGGFLVDASRATVQGGSLAAGLRVEIEGRFEGGVLVARKVEIEDASGAGEFEMRGTVASVDVAGQTFMLVGRSEVIGTSRADLVYEGGTATSLTVGRGVELKGVLSADRTRVDATQIEFE